MQHFARVYKKITDVKDDKNISAFVYIHTTATKNSDKTYDKFVHR